LAFHATEKGPAVICRKSFHIKQVRETGLEPARVAPLDPKSSASANSATLAHVAAALLSRLLYHGKRHTFTIGKVEPDEAKANQVDYLLMRIRQGLLTVPPGTDIVVFLRHDGKPPEPKSPAANQFPPEAPTLTLGALYLTLPEIQQILGHVQRAATQPWLHPMLCFAAYTGARRAEILRALAVCKEASENAQKTPLDNPRKAPFRSLFSRTMLTDLLDRDHHRSPFGFENRSNASSAPGRLAPGGRQSTRSGHGSPTSSYRLPRPQQPKPTVYPRPPARTSQPRSTPVAFRRPGTKP
jgi:hypothetical protein